MDTTKSDEQQMPINTSDEMSRGRYSNSMLVAHGAEEFIMDWLLQSPNGMHLQSRVIVSPGHMKRIIRALEENMEQYERDFGEIRVAESTPTMVQ